MSLAGPFNHSAGAVEYFDSTFGREYEFAGDDGGDSGLIEVVASPSSSNKSKTCKSSSEQSSGSGESFGWSTEGSRSSDSTSAWSKSMHGGHQSPAPCYGGDDADMPQFEAVLASLRAMDSSGEKAKLLADGAAAAGAGGHDTMFMLDKDVSQLLYRQYYSNLQQYSSSPPPPADKLQDGGKVSSSSKWDPQEAASTFTGTDNLQRYKDTTTTTALCAALSTGPLGPSHLQLQLQDGTRQEGSSSLEASSDSSAAPRFVRRRAAADTQDNTDCRLSLLTAGRSAPQVASLPPVLTGMESCPHEEASAADHSPPNYHHHHGGQFEQASTAVTAKQQEGLTLEHFHPSSSSSAPRLSLDFSSLPQASTSWPNQYASQQQQHQQASANVVVGSQQAEESSSVQHRSSQPQATLSPYSQLQQSLQAFQQHYIATSPPDNVSLYPSSFPSASSISSSNTGGHDGVRHATPYGESMRDSIGGASNTSTPSSSSCPHSAISSHSQGFNVARPASQNAFQNSTSLGDMRSEWLSPTSESSFSHQQQRQPFQQVTNNQSYPDHVFSQQSQYQQPDQYHQLSHSHVPPTGTHSAGLYASGQHPVVSPSPYQAGSHWQPDTSNNGRHNVTGLHINTGIIASDSEDGGASQRASAMGSNVRENSRSSYGTGTSTGAYQEPPSPYLTSPGTSAPHHSFPSSAARPAQDVGNASTYHPAGPPSSTQSQDTLRKYTGYDADQASITGQQLSSVPVDAWSNQLPHQMSGVNSSHVLPQFPMYTSSSLNGSYDFGFEDLPLHFDYSKPGDPQPLLEARTTSTSSHIKSKRPTMQANTSVAGKSSGHSRRTSTNRSVSNSSSSGSLQSQPSDAAPISITPSDSGESTGSNFFSKGLKRRRPGTAITTSVGSENTGTSSSSMPEDPSSASSLGKKGLTNFMQGYHEAMPHIAGLQLNNATVIQPQPQPYPYTTGAQSAEAAPSAYQQDVEPSSPAETDAVDGMDLQDEKEVTGTKASGTTSGRRQYECKICSRCKSRSS